jgi:hypothetical protein
METKKCSKCGEVKSVKEFDKGKRSKDGLRSQCKSCRKQYHAQHKEEKKQYRKQYYEQHKEEVKQKNKQYYEQHKEEAKQKNKQYKERHKEEIEQICKTTRSRYMTLQSSAKRRNIEINLSFEDFVSISSQPCVYCGEVCLDTVGCHLDRWMNSKGYMIDNVVSCCGKCNMAKNIMDGPEFLEWIDKVSKHSKNLVQVITWKGQLELRELDQFSEKILPEFEKVVDEELWNLVDKETK